MTERAKKQCGHAGISLLTSVLLVLTLVGLATAATIVKYYDGDAVNGTFKAEASGGVCTLTVDRVVSSYSGNGASLTNISAANLAAGTTASAINGNSITNLSAANLRAGTAASAINGASITNLNGANIASGDIAAARLTLNAVVVSDYAATNQVLVGTGAGTFQAISGLAPVTITIEATNGTHTVVISGGIITSWTTP